MMLLLIHGGMRRIVFAMMMDSLLSLLLHAFLISRWLLKRRTAMRWPMRKRWGCGGGGDDLTITVTPTTSIMFIIMFIIVVVVVVLVVVVMVVIVVIVVAVIIRLAIQSYHFFPG